MIVPRRGRNLLVALALAAALGAPAASAQEAPAPDPGPDLVAPAPAESPPPAPDDPPPTVPPDDPELAATAALVEALSAETLTARAEAARALAARIDERGLAARFHEATIDGALRLLRGEAPAPAETRAAGIAGIALAEALAALDLHPGPNPRAPNAPAPPDSPLPAALTALLTNEDEAVTAHAAVALAWYGDGAARPVLRAALDRPPTPGGEGDHPAPERLWRALAAVADDDDGPRFAALLDAPALPDEGPLDAGPLDLPPDARLAARVLLRLPVRYRKGGSDPVSARAANDQDRPLARANALALLGNAAPPDLLLRALAEGPPVRRRRAARLVAGRNLNEFQRGAVAAALAARLAAGAWATDAGAALLPEEFDLFAVHGGPEDCAQLAPVLDALLALAPRQTAREPLLRAARQALADLVARHGPAVLAPLFAEAPAERRALLLEELFAFPEHWERTRDWYQAALEHPRLRALALAAFERYGRPEDGPRLAPLWDGRHPEARLLEVAGTMHTSLARTWATAVLTGGHRGALAAAALRALEQVGAAVGPATRDAIFEALAAHTRAALDTWRDRWEQAAPGRLPADFAARLARCRQGDEAAFDDVMPPAARVAYRAVTAALAEQRELEALAVSVLGLPAPRLGVEPRLLRGFPRVNQAGRVRLGGALIQGGGAGRAALFAAVEGDRARFEQLAPELPPDWRREAFGSLSTPNTAARRTAVELLAAAEPERGVAWAQAAWAREDRRYWEEAAALTLAVPPEFRARALPADAAPEPAARAELLLAVLERAEPPLAPEFLRALLSAAEPALRARAARVIERAAPVIDRATRARWFEPVAAALRAETDSGALAPLLRVLVRLAIAGDTGLQRKAASTVVKTAPGVLPALLESADSRFSEAQRPTARAALTRSLATVELARYYCLFLPGGREDWLEGAPPLVAEATLIAMGASEDYTTGLTLPWHWQRSEGPRRDAAAIGLGLRFAALVEHHRRDGTIAPPRPDANAATRAVARRLRHLLDRGEPWQQGLAALALAGWAPAIARDALHARFLAGVDPAVAAAALPPEATADLMRAWLSLGDRRALAPASLVVHSQSLDAREAAAGLLTYYRMDFLRWGPRLGLNAAQRMRALYAAWRVAHPHTDPRRARFHIDPRLTQPLEAQLLAGASPAELADVSAALMGRRDSSRDRSAVPLLLRLARDHTRDLRGRRFAADFAFETLAALAQPDGRDFGRDLGKWQRWWDEQPDNPRAR